MRTQLSRLVLSAIAAAALAAAAVDAGAQRLDTGAARTPPPRPAPARLSVVPVPPPPPGIDRLAVFPGNPEKSKKCTTVAGCDDLISQCYADAGNPGDWACHEENSQGQCSTGTCVF